MALLDAAQAVPGLLIKRKEPNRHWLLESLLKQAAFIANEVLRPICAIKIRNNPS